MSQADGGTLPGGRRVTGRKELKAEMDGQDQTHSLVPGYDQIAAEAGRRHRPRPGQTSRLARWQTSEHAATQPGVPGAAGLRLVIGVDGDQRAWVPVANALLEHIASGTIKAGSRVPPVTCLGLECPLAPGTAGRAFRALAGEGVLHWVPGLGYHVRTSFTVAVSDRPRQDGRLTAVLPGGGQRQQAERGAPAGSGAGAR